MAFLILGSLGERSERGSWRSQSWVAMRVDCRKGRPGKFPPRLVSDFGSSTGGPDGNGARDSLKTLRGGPETAGNPRHRARAAENEPLRAPLERRSPERMGLGPPETGADPGAAAAELEDGSSSCGLSGWNEEFGPDSPA